jgi:hypothetical protein
MTDTFHSPAFDDALQNIGHALLAADPRRELTRVLATFRDEYRTEVLNGQTILLNEAERRMLAYALDEAQEKIWSEGGFTDEDQGAVDSLRRLLVEAAPVHSVVADAEQRLVRAREVHQETCLLARGDVKPTAFTCGMCEALAPAGH